MAQKRSHTGQFLTRRLKTPPHKTTIPAPVRVYWIKCFPAASDHNFTREEEKCRDRFRRHVGNIHRDIPCVHTRTFLKYFPERGDTAKEFPILGIMCTRHKVLHAYEGRITTKRTFSYSAPGTPALIFIARSIRNHGATGTTTRRSLC